MKALLYTGIVTLSLLLISGLLIGFAWLHDRWGRHDRRRVMPQPEGLSDQPHRESPFTVIGQIFLCALIGLFFGCAFGVGYLADLPAWAPAIQ